MSYKNALKIAGIIRDAGGRIVGRTRLQKIAYLLSITGLEEGVAFSYKHYGPFSEDVATAARLGDLVGDIEEREQPTFWGGSYSVYTATREGEDDRPSPRREIAAMAAEADAIELELAATAVFLAREGYDDPWGETARRKPDKAASGRIERSKGLLRRLRAIKTPVELPPIV